jgi:hypothetical protein
MESHKRDGSNLRFSCPICNASYARNFALKDHIKEQHAEIHTEPGIVTELIPLEISLDGEYVVEEVNDDSG